MRKTRIAVFEVISQLAVMASFSFSQATTPTPGTAATQSNADRLPLRFEVVSIKRNTRVGPWTIDSPPNGDSVTITNMTPHMMIGLAFGLPLHDEIYNLPGWTDSEHYDLVAKVPETELPAFHALLPMQRNPMLQAVLEDRFHLKYHYQAKALVGYKLIVGKSGAKLEEIQPAIGANGLPEPGRMHGARGEITGEGVSMADFSQLLSQQVGRPVVDGTGLRGNYNFTLKWTPDLGSAATPSGLGPGPSIFTAIQEQLGLKLTSAKVPVRTLVVDQIERPEEN